jgi:hypothetical protein
MARSQPDPDSVVHQDLGPGRVRCSTAAAIDMPGLK